MLSVAHSRKEGGNGDIVASKFTVVVWSAQARCRSSPASAASASLNASAACLTRGRATCMMHCGNDLIRAFCVCEVEYCG